MRVELFDGSNMLKKKVLKNVWNFLKVNFVYKLFLVFIWIIFKKVNLYLEFIYMLIIFYYVFILKDWCIFLCRFL